MLLAGFAERMLPVPAGQPLMGHTRDDYRASGTHDALLCKVILWDDGKQMHGLIALDLCMVDARFVSEMQTMIESVTDCQGDRFTICATHTHAGPASLSLYGAPVMDAPVRNAIMDTAAKAVADALAAREPVRLRYGHAACRENIAFFRRVRKKDQSLAMNWEIDDPREVSAPLGTFDAEVRVLEMLGDSLHVALVNYPLHPAILDYENLLYSRDFPGYLETALQQIVGDELRVLFVNGCCADVNHIDHTDRDMPRRGYAAAERVGYILAAAAAEAIRRAKALRTSRVRRVTRTVELPRVTVPPGLLDQAQRALQGDSPESSSTDGLPFTLQAPLILEASRLAGTRLQTVVSLLRIGPLSICCFPGEMAHAVERSIGADQKDMPWMAIELADDAIGYVATEDEYDQGGYETQIGATKVARGSAEILMEQMSGLFRQLV